MKDERRYSKHQLNVYCKKSDFVSNSKFKHSKNFRVKGSFVDVTEDTDMDLSHSLLHWKGKHLSKKHRFFEVKFLSEVTKDQLVMIGLNPRSHCKPMIWDKEQSIRYSSVEGGVFACGAGVRSDHPFGNEGDVVAVYLEASFKGSALINFFLNGHLVYRQWIDVSHKRLYPTIGVSKGPANFKVIWPGQNKDPSVNLGIDKVHTLLSNWIGFRQIKKDDDTHTLEVTERDQANRKGYSLQAARPLDHVNNYFEIELLTRVDPEMGPSIGLTSAWTSKFQYPGWTHDTIGYHSDEGSFYNDDGYKPSTEPESNLQCQIGDRMGCGVVFSKKDHTECQLATVYFTRNNEIVYVKPRMLPLGGFYPTVGLYEPGEIVRVTNPCIENKVTLPTEDLGKMKPWERLYKEFKFHESILFDDFLSSGSTRRISMNFRSKTAQMIHHISGAKDLYLLQFKVIDIGSKSEIFIRSVPRSYTTTNRYVFNDMTLKDVLCFSKRTGLLIGDKVFVTVQVNTTGLQITAIKNGKIVGQSFSANDGSPNWEDQMPTIAFQNGRATLDVLWPGSVEFKHICNNKVSITKYINEIMPTSDSETSDNEVIQNEACKQDENENEVRSLENDNEKTSSNEELDVSAQENDTIQDDMHYDKAQTETTMQSNETNNDRKVTESNKSNELILEIDELSDDSETEKNGDKSQEKSSQADIDSGKVKQKCSSMCTVM